MLSDEVQDLSGGGWPLGGFVAQGIGTATTGRVLGTVAVHDLYLGSASNPTQTAATSDPVAVTVDVRLDVSTTLPEEPPADFQPITPEAEELHWRWRFYQLQPEWRDERFSSEEDRQAADAAVTAYEGDPQARAEARTRYETMRREAWQRTRAGTVRVQFVEFLTTAADVNGMVEDLSKQALLDFLVKATGTRGAVISLPAPGEFGKSAFGSTSETQTRNAIIGAWVAADYRTSNFQQFGLKPELAPGHLRTLASDTRTLDPFDRRTLVWRFSVPEALLRQLDTGLPAGYRWGFGIVWSAQHAGVQVTASAPVARYFYRGANGDPQASKNAPGFASPTVSGATTQGILHGTLFYGPARVAGVWVAQSRLIIGVGGWRTEFQAGARQ